MSETRCSAPCCPASRGRNSEIFCLDGAQEKLRTEQATTAKLTEELAAVNVRAI